MGGWPLVFESAKDLYFAIKHTSDLRRAQPSTRNNQPVKVEIRNPFSPKAKGCLYINQDDGIPTIRVKPRLWTSDREAFWQVYLHEVGHLREHVSKIKPSDGNVTKAVRGDDLRGKVLAISDGVDELAAYLWAE